MPDLKQRFAMADDIEPRELWTEARRRAVAAEGSSIAVDWPPGTGRRIAVGAVAFAVFAAAVVFAWDLSHPDPGFGPDPSPAVVDLASELPGGWSELPAPPEVRSGAATAWTGSQLLVWGGYEYTGYSDESSQDDGFVYDARSRRWSPLAAGPLEGRSDPASAWTGDEWLIWGGRFDGGNPSGRFFADGAAYDPSARTWRPLPEAPIDGRAPFSIWTGSELVLWGSTDRTARRLDGAVYDPAADRWRPIAEGPVHITDGSAVWSGDEMLVVGAALDGNNHADTPTAVGAAYDPETAVWRELPTSNLSPQAMTAAWLNGELVAWDYDLASEAYDPGVDRWRPLGGVPLEFSECRPESVSTSGIVLGDFCGRTVEFTSKEQTWRRVSLPSCCSCCRANELVAAGDVILVMSHAIAMESLDVADRRMFVYNPPTVTDPDPPAGSRLEPFVPTTQRSAGEVQMPVVFPDGSRATLEYPIALDLATLGVQPDVSYIWRDDPSPRYPIVFLHDPNASMRTYVAGAEPITIVDGREIWAMSDEWESHRNQLQGVWVRLRLDSWTVLVASTAVEDAVAVADYLHMEETRVGFPVVEAVGPIALATGFGESEGPQLGFGDARPEPDRVSQLDATIFLSPDGCSAGSEVSAGYGSACLGGGSVFASIYGSRGFVERVVDGLRVEHFRKM
jgi:hypothetical protein